MRDYERQFDAFERFVWRVAVAAVCFLLSVWSVARLAIWVWHSLRS